MQKNALLNDISFHDVVRPSAIMEKRESPWAKGDEVEADERGRSKKKRA
jgi:hypothetical protein